MICGGGGEGGPGGLRFFPMETSCVGLILQQRPVNLLLL